MKRTVCLLIACLLLLAAVPAAQAEETAPAPPDAAAPIVLLNEEYNPFYSATYPQPYTITTVRCGISPESMTYRLILLTSASMDSVLAFAASLIASDDAINTMPNAVELMSSGSTVIQGSLESGIPFVIDINERPEEDSAADGNRFMLQLTATLPPEAQYLALFEANLQHPVYQEIAAYFALLPIQQASITVMLDANRAEMFCSYPLDNAQQIADKLLETYPDQYYAESNWLVWRIEKMQLIIALDGCTDGELAVLANFASPEISLVAYTPETETSEALPAGDSSGNTLQSLGFADFRGTSAKCTNQNNSAGVWLSVSKDAWGANSNETERNALTFMAKEHDAFILVFYYPQTQTYAVSVDNNGESTKYQYLVDENRYTDAYGGDELTEVLRIVSSAFLGPDETCDDVLGVAIGMMQSFIQNDLGTTVDALYAMDYE